MTSSSSLTSSFSELLIYKLCQLQPRVPTVFLSWFAEKDSWYPSLHRQVVIFFSLERKVAAFVPLSKAMGWRGEKRVSLSSPPPALNFFAFSSFSTSSMANSTILSSSLTLSSSKILLCLFQLLKGCYVGTWRVTFQNFLERWQPAIPIFVHLLFFLSSLFATQFLTTPCKIPSLGEGNLLGSILQLF